MTNDLRIGKIILKKVAIDEAPDSREKRKAIIEAIRENPEDLIYASDEFLSFCTSIKNMKDKYPDEAWPDLTIEYMAATAQSWLPHGIENKEDIYQEIRDLELVNLAGKILTTSQKNKLNQIEI